MKKLIISIVLALIVLWFLKPFNIVILGSDARPWQPLKGSRSDSIMLLNVNPLLAKIKIVSIPRDSYTLIDCEKGGKTDKITHALAFGGPKCSVRALENMLNTKIQYHVLLRFEDVINITALVDGVNIISNHTFTQDNQSFVKGKIYNIKGDRALAYARHRKTDSDYKRGDRQKQIFSGLQSKILSPSGILKIPSIIAYCNTHMEIKFNPLRLISILPAVTIHGSNYDTLELKGDGKIMNGIWYFIPDSDSLKQIKKEFKVWI